MLVTTVLPYGETSEDRLIAGGMKPVGKWVFKELRRSFSVRFLYAFKSLSKIGWNFEAGRYGSRVNVRHEGVSEELGGGVYCIHIDKRHGARAGHSG